MTTKRVIGLLLICGVVAAMLMHAPAFAEKGAPPESVTAPIAKYWAMRDHQAQCQKTIALLEKALATYPKWERGWHWLGYAYFMEGDNWPPKDKRRIESYRKGMEIGRKSIEMNETSAGAHHWYITNKACYGRERGILRSVYYLPEILREINRVKQLDNTYDDGGPQRLITGIICQVPASLRKSKGYSLQDAEREMNEAIQIAPNHPRNWLFLADVHLRMDKKAEAKSHLEHLMAMTPDQCPGREPELRQDQAAARKMLSKHFSQ